LERLAPVLHDDNTFEAFEEYEQYALALEIYCQPFIHQ
jgi:hypothetical protein